MACGSVSFVNEGVAYHELAIVAPDGTYRMACREPGHTEAGMVGTLTVTG